MFDTSTLIAFTVASILLVAAPGPGQALVIARTLQGGARYGLLTASGLEIGTLLHTVAAALGLSVIVATSASAFTAVKLAGAAYLVVLGVLTWRNAGREATAGAPAPASNSRLLLHGAVTGTLNPKVAVFFVAFLPQFVDPARGRVVVQFLVLGVLFSLIGLLGDSLVALLTARARTRILRTPLIARWRDRVAGTILVGLGLRLALLSRR